MRSVNNYQELNQTPEEEREEFREMLARQQYEAEKAMELYEIQRHCERDEDE